MKLASVMLRRLQITSFLYPLAFDLMHSAANRHAVWRVYSFRMKFVNARPYSDPEAAARKLIEIANGVEAVQDGLIFVDW